jgi:Tfp pilus assembly protein FimT
MVVLVHSFKKREKITVALVVTEFKYVERANGRDCSLIAKGFSYLELLVVLILCGILAGAIFPSLHFFIAKTRAETASQQILGELARARSLAAHYADTVTLCKSADMAVCGGSWEQGQILFLDKNHNGVVPDGNSVLASFEPMPDAVLHWRSSLARDYLQSEPPGGKNIEDGTFWYCARGDSKPAWAIRINPWGRARLEMPDSKGKIKDLKC